MGIFWFQKKLRLGINNKNFNPKVIYIIIFNKTACWYKIYELSFKFFVKSQKVFQNF